MSHHLDERFLKKHIKTGNTGGGACLNRHERRKENNSCSHQWQGYKKAESDPGVYDYPKYASIVGKQHKTGARTAKRGNIFPKGMQLSTVGPNPYDWDIGGQKTTANNFKDWRIPYWHNAHHIIPNGVLAECIADASAEDKSLRLLIRAGLLGAKYNLNHMVNMIILPMGQEVAHALGLPRHLLGDKPPPGYRREVRSHGDYSRKVKDKLESVMEDYMQILEQKGKDHPAPPNNLSKARLEDCSKDLYNQIKTFGQAQPGAALSEMTPDYFR